MSNAEFHFISFIIRCIATLFMIFVLRHQLILLKDANGTRNLRTLLTVMSVVAIITLIISAIGSLSIHYSLFVDLQRDILPIVNAIGQLAQAYILYRIYTRKY